MDFGFQSSIISEQMRMSPKSMAEISCGGVGAGLAIKHAMNEIIMGHIDLAICYGAERERSMRKRMLVQWLEQPPRRPEFLDPTCQTLAGFSIIWTYACSGRRYMYEFGAIEARALLSQ